MSDTTATSEPVKPVDRREMDESRRDFLEYAAGGMAAIGAGAFIWPIISSMNPAADTLALASIEVDLSKIAEGQAIKVLWRGKPVFIRHRTAEEIAQAEAVELDALRDAQTDAERTTDANGTHAPQWLVMVGICTHLGCIPLGTAKGEARGEYDGWFCPCHGSHYDASGRIRKGPAPSNLAVPDYRFTSDALTRIVIG